MGETEKQAVPARPLSGAEDSDGREVPAAVLRSGRKYYQYTAKGECARWTYGELYGERPQAAAKVWAAVQYPHPDLFLRPNL